MKKLLLYALFISSSIILLSPLNAFADGSVNCDRICMTGGNLPSGWCPGVDQKEFTIPAQSQNIQIGFLQVYPYSSLTLNTGETLTVSILIREKYGKPMDDYSVFQGGIAMLYGDNYTNILNQVDSNIYDLSGNYLYDQAHALSYHVNAILYVIKLEAKSNINGLGSLSFRSNLFLGSSFSNSDTIVINATIYKGSKNYTDILLENLVSSMGADSSNIASIKSGVDNVNSSINNSSTSDANNTGSSFFSGFQTESFGHLTDIITAPLGLFSAITSTTCNPITLNVDFSDSTNGAVGSHNVVLPCGTTLFWENSSLGSKVSNFRTFWNILLGAPLIYGCLLLLVRSFNSALDPLNDELIAFEYNKDSERVYRDMKSQEVRDMATLNHEGGLNAAQYKKYAILRRKK